MKLQITDVVSVYDGDTFTARFLYEGRVTRPFKIRIHGIDCPEIKASTHYERKLALLAREATREALKNAKSITVSTMGLDRYERVLCSVRVDGRLLKRILIEKGLAKSYQGGKRIWEADKLAAKKSIFKM